MPAHKDLKRRVRARMQKTGESYTTARTQLLKKTRAPGEAHSSSPRLDPVAMARRAGMSNDAVAAKTGHDWAGWVELLDAWGAHQKPHRAIARHLAGEHTLPGWWAQMVTVGYERIRGLRDVGQKRGESGDRSYEANKSKTFPVPLDRLYRAFSQKRLRRRWLGELDPTVRTSRIDKSMRWVWPDGTPVEISFLAKGKQKSQVAIQHSRLASKDEVGSCKQAWAERLTALAELLARG